MRQDAPTLKASFPSMQSTFFSLLYCAGFSPLLSMFPYDTTKVVFGIFLSAIINCEASKLIVSVVVLDSITFFFQRLVSVEKFLFINDPADITYNSDAGRQAPGKVCIFVKVLS